MEYLNRDPVGDGGQFDMAVNIVEVSFARKRKTNPEKRQRTRG